MCSCELYDVCRFFWQIYIKIPNDKPVKTKKSLFFRRMTQNGDGRASLSDRNLWLTWHFLLKVLVDDDDKPLLNVIDEFMDSPQSTTSLPK